MTLELDILNNSNDLYLINQELEVKIYFFDDNGNKIDITNNKDLMVYSLDNEIVFVYDKVIDKPYRLFFKSNGLTTVYFVYDYENEKLTLTKNFKILNSKFDNTQKKKSRIEIRRENEKNYGVNNAHLLDSYVNFYVFLINESDEEEDITQSKDLSFYSLDDDNLFIFQKKEDMPFEVFFRKEGTGFLKAIYNDGINPLLVDSRNFICYTSFFKDKYLDYFVGDFNKEKIIANQQTKVVFDTFMEMLDILYAYNQDLKEISSFDNTKSNFLDLLAQNIGFLRVDTLSVNTPMEDKEDYIFRELLKNMVDVLSVRGTKAAYELFFGAMGYNIRLNEFWYDENGDLVEIDPYDELKTTYIGYYTDGSLKNNVAQKQKDPRKNMSKQERYIFNIQSENDKVIRLYDIPFDMPNIDNVFIYINCIKCGPKRDFKIINKTKILFREDLNLNDGDAVFLLKTPDYNVFKNSKSNYIRVNISSKDTNKFTPPSFFSTQKKRILNYYLDFLKPIHMQYLPEFLITDLAQTQGEIGEKIDIDSFANASDFKRGKFRGYINSEVVGKVPAIPIKENVFDDIFSMGMEADKNGTDINTYINKFENFNIEKNSLDENKKNIKNGIFDSYGKKCLRWDVDNIKFDLNYGWDEKGFLIDSLAIIKK